MCARLLSCPLCSQPGFVTLDALRAGLVSVATRPLVCPVCNETLLGIDKLTIHLFGHTINAINRSDNRKLTDNNRNNNVNGGETPSESMLLSQNWNTSGNTPLMGDRSRSEEITNEKLAFLPLSNLSPARSVAAIVIDKNSDSSTAAVPRGYAAAPESIEKSQNRIIFVPNLNQQRQQYCPARLIRTDDGSGTTERQTYEASAPLIFNTAAAGNKTISPAVAAQNCVKENAACSDIVNCIGIYRRDNIAGHSGLEAKEEKEDNSQQFTDTWIENLLQENSDKCSASFTKSSESEKKIHASDVTPKSANGEEKYSDYRRSPSAKSENGEEKRLESRETIAEKNENVFNGNCGTSIISIDALPQLKTFRLLAMKDKTERCNICGIPVPDSNILILHKQVVHMIAEKDMNGTPEELLKNYPCHFCTKIFKNRGSLMVHMRIAHIGYNLGLDAECLSKGDETERIISENGYNCPTCGKNFKKEQHVTQHLKTHEGKQWECDVCSKMFTTKYFLKKHKRLHSGEMPYKCTLCEKTFTFQQSYHKHRLYHKDDKPHTCATCGRSFKELSTLHNHERIHTGEKPFVCETCGKCFRQRVSYLVHRRIHTGVMPYKCVACGKNFRYKVSQRTHKCPVQQEDSVLSVPEAASTSIPVRSNNSCNGSASAIVENTMFERDPTIPEISITENKFILIMNNQGQPILTRESDVRTSFLSDTKNTEKSLENEKINRDNTNDDPWNHSSVKEATKDSTSSPINEETTGEKLSNDTNDFFSLVMSPMENDLSSPSTEMEHLRLSSPRNEDGANHSREVCKGDETNIQNDLNNAIEGILSDNCSGNSLGTINEESLKQLLYGIDRKD